MWMFISHVWQFYVNNLLINHPQKGLLAFKANKNQIKIKKR